MKRLVLLCALAALSRRAGAHPLDEIGICHDSVVQIAADGARVCYVLWFAEIPAYDERRALDANGDQVWTRAEKQEYGSALAALIRTQLHLQLDGRPLRLRAQEFHIPKSQYYTMSLEVRFVFAAKWGPLAPGEHVLHFVDASYAKEYGSVTVKAEAGKGVKLLGQTSRQPGEKTAAETVDAAEFDQAYAPPPQYRELTAKFAALAAAAPVAAAKPARRERPAAQAAAPAPARRAATTTVAAPSPPLQRKSAKRSRWVKERLKRMIAAKNVGAAYWALALVIAAALGALHALEPGHGKSLVAAYLVGTKGRVRDAVVLGLVVTLAHTGSVMALGFVLLSLQEYVAPRVVGPAVTIVSGLVIAGIGVWLLVARALGLSHGHSHPHPHAGHAHPHDHVHDHSHDHDHEHAHGHDHAHEHAHEHEPDHDHEHGRAHSHAHDPESARGHSHEERSVSLSTLIPLGVSGGIVPCPPAIVALIFAFSVGRLAAGLAIIFAFSAGLAAVLTGVGIAMVSLRGFAERFRATGPLLRVLPVLSALIVTGLGLAVVVQGLIEAGVVVIRL